MMTMCDGIAYQKKKKKRYVGGNYGVGHLLLLTIAIKKVQLSFFFCCYNVPNKCVSIATVDSQVNYCSYLFFFFFAHVQCFLTILNLPSTALVSEEISSV